MPILKPEKSSSPLYTIYFLCGTSNCYSMCHGITSELMFVLSVHTVNREKPWRGTPPTSCSNRSKLLSCEGCDTKLAVRCNRCSAEWSIGPRRLEWWCCSIGRSKWGLQKQIHRQFRKKKKKKKGSNNVIKQHCEIKTYVWSIHSPKPKTRNRCAKNVLLLLSPLLGYYR